MILRGTLRPKTQVQRFESLQRSEALREAPAIVGLLLYKGSQEMEPPILGSIYLVRLWHTSSTNIQANSPSGAVAPYAIGRIPQPWRQQSVRKEQLARGLAMYHDSIMLRSCHPSSTAGGRNPAWPPYIYYNNS